MKLNTKLGLNFLYLGIGQGVTFLVPLLLSPFLISVIGVSNFGLVISYQAIMTYFSVFTDYGFNLTAVKDCSINRFDNLKLNEIIVDVYLTKFFLFFISFFFVFLVYYFTDNNLLILSFSLVLSKVISPNWYFQGVEKMHLLAIFSIASKLISVFFIFIFIKNEMDYVFINAVLSIGDFVVSVYGIFYIFNSLGNNRPILPPLHRIKYQLYTGFPILITNFANNIYLNSNIIILGYFASDQIVGYYAIAEKIMVTVKQIAVVILQSTYSYACTLANESLARLKSFLRMEVFFMGSLFLAFSVFLFFLSDIIVDFFVNSNKEITVRYVRYLCFVPFIVSLNMPAYKMLIINNLKKGYLSVVVFGSVLNIIFNFVLAYYYLEMGTIYAVILTELFITIGFYIIISTKYPAYKFITISK